MSGKSKKVEKGWQKRAGLDLRLAKTRILKDELAKSRQEGRVLPKTDSAQVHAHVHGNVKRKRKRKASSNDEPAEAEPESELEPETTEKDLFADTLERMERGEKLTEKQLSFRERIKREVMGKLRKLEKTPSLKERLTELRKAEGYIYCVFKLGGDFSISEADFIVECAIRHQERPGGHPLQISGVYSRLPKFAPNNTTYNTELYSFLTMRQALFRHGFYLNLGEFSPSEDLTLMTNFEKFLTSKGHATDPESIAKLVKHVTSSIQSIRCSFSSVKV